MASAIVFSSPFLPIAPRALARRGQPRRPHPLISGVTYRGKRLGNDSERVYVTFNPSDDSNAPGSTPSPEAAPASAQGQQAATASGTTPSLSAGFPLPLEKGGGQDFWGGGGAGKAPSEEDVVQIPIEGIPEKIAPARQEEASATGTDAASAAALAACTEDTAESHAADEPEAAKEATAAAAHAAFAEETPAAEEDTKATDWDGADSGFESDGLGGVSDEEHTDRGWGVYGPIAAAIDAGRKAREAMGGAADEQLYAAGVAPDTSSQEVAEDGKPRNEGSADAFRAYADSVKASGGREEDAMFAKWASLPAAERDTYLRRAEDMMRLGSPTEPPTRELVDAAGQELSRGWKFIKDAASEWDSRAAEALTEAGAVIQASLSSVDEEVTAALTGVFNGLDEAVPGGTPTKHGGHGQDSNGSEGVAEPPINKATAAPVSADHEDGGKEHAVAAEAREEATTADEEDDEEKRRALYEQFVLGPRGLRELEAEMVELGFDLASEDMLYKSEHQDLDSSGLDVLKQHIIDLQCFLDTHIDLTIYVEDGNSYAAITDDNGDEHEVEIPLRELHEIRSAAGRIQHELEFMWEKVDVLTKYPVSIRARAPSSDQSEEDIDPEEECTQTSIGLQLIGELATRLRALDGCVGEVRSQAQAAHDGVLALQAQAQTVNGTSEQQGEVETLGETVADVVERLQQLDEQVVALDARMSSVPQEDEGQEELLTARLNHIDGKLRATEAWLTDISAESNYTKEELRDYISDRLRPLESMYTGVGAFETSVLANVKALAARVETLEEASEDEEDVDVYAKYEVDDSEEDDDAYDDDDYEELEQRVCALERDRHSAITRLDETSERVTMLQDEGSELSAQLQQVAVHAKWSENARGMINVLRTELNTVQRRMDKSQVWVEELIEEAKAKGGKELDAKLDAKLAAKLQDALDAHTLAEQPSESELQRFRLSAIAAGHAFKQQTAVSEAQAAQVAKLQQEVEALRKLAAPPPPASAAGALWRLVLGMAAIAARAAAAATGALAMLYAAVALPGVRNALHNALAAEPGSVRLPVLAVLGVAAFMATALSVAAGRMATARPST